MALVAIKVTIGQSLGGGAYSSSVNGGAAPDFATAVTDVATLVSHNVAVTPVESAVAVLEADAASPTQGHVNSLRTVWNTLSAACTTHNGDANTLSTDITALNSAAAGDVTVIWDTTKITTVSQLRHALERVARGAMSGIGALTP